MLKKTLVQLMNRYQQLVLIRLLIFLVGGFFFILSATLFIFYWGWYEHWSVEKMFLVVLSLWLLLSAFLMVMHYRYSLQIYKLKHDLSLITRSYKVIVSSLLRVFK